MTSKYEKLSAMSSNPFGDSSGDENENAESEERPRQDESQSEASASSGTIDPERGETVPIRTRLEVQEEYVPCLFRYITVIARIAGIITAVVLWVITGNFIHTQNTPGKREGYMIFLSITITLFECIWLINFCASKFKKEGCICACWEVCLWFDNWKKTIFYVGITIPCVVAPILTALTILAAILVFATAFLYFLRSFKGSSCVKRTRRIQTDAYTEEVVPRTDPKTKLVSQSGNASTDYDSLEINKEQNGAKSK